MENYINAELSHMHFLYDWSDKNGRQIRRFYAELYPERHHTIFVHPHQSLRENRTFKKKTVDCGRPREARTVQLEEAVYELIAESPVTSIRKIVNKLNKSIFTVFKFLYPQLYPFYNQRVQAVERLNTFLFFIKSLKLIMMFFKWGFVYWRSKFGKTVYTNNHI